ncbi:hypothetical protein DSO57_1008242 [Entomophthora muscae]|uniref:Uncharacterized protein n=1 Tax=Entomophthora muscae TaxID=34485 RepID=A0ACC2TIG8_9FUNG|nr:hypothetical protein DSO57_1008242 [Entomophthora muscae]
MTTPSSWSLATIQDTLGDWWTGTPQTGTPSNKTSWKNYAERHCTYDHTPSEESDPNRRVKKLTWSYKEHHLHAPSDIPFDTPATHLVYYNTLKLYVMRNVNLDQVTNLQSLYCEAEKAEQTSNAFHKVQTGKRE